VLPVASVTSESGDNKTSKRFHRTNEEIRLGLSREQAMAKRGVRAKVSVTEAPAIIMPEGKRFRRTAKEIELGLTKEEAAVQRQRSRSEPPKLNLDKTAVEQHEATLSPKIHARARAVHRYRAAGGKAVLTPDTSIRSSSSSRPARSRSARRAWIATATTTSTRSTRPPRRRLHDGHHQPPAGRPPLADVVGSLSPPSESILFCLYRDSFCSRSDGLFNSLPGLLDKASGAYTTLRSHSQIP
jgi:hypothetical protein